MIDVDYSIVGVLVSQNPIDTQYQEEINTTSWQKGKGMVSFSGYQSDMVFIITCTHNLLRQIVS
jgi:hypothetical protein